MKRQKYGSVLRSNSGLPHPHSVMTFARWRIGTSAAAWSVLGPCSATMWLTASARVSASTPSAGSLLVSIGTLFTCWPRTPPAALMSYSAERIEAFAYGVGPEPTPVKSQSSANEIDPPAPAATAPVPVATATTSEPAAIAASAPSERRLHLMSAPPPHHRLALKRRFVRAPGASPAAHLLTRWAPPLRPRCSLTARRRKWPQRRAPHGTPRPTRRSAPCRPRARCREPRSPPPTRP